MLKIPTFQKKMPKMFAYYHLPSPQEDDAAVELFLFYAAYESLGIDIKLYFFSFHSILLCGSSMVCYL